MLVCEPQSVSIAATYFGAARFEMSKILMPSHDAFSLAIADTMWLALAGAAAATLVVAVIVPEVPLRQRANGAAAGEAVSRGPVAIAE